MLTPGNSTFTAFGAVTATAAGLFLGGPEGPQGGVHLDSDARCGGGSYPCYFVHFDQMLETSSHIPPNTYGESVGFLFSNNGALAANEFQGIGSVDGSTFVPGSGTPFATPLPPFLLVHRLFTRLVDRVLIEGPVPVGPPGDPLAVDVIFAESYYTSGDIGAATAALDSFVSGVRERSDQIPPGISKQLIADALAIEAAFKCAGTRAATGCGDAAQ